MIQKYFIIFFRIVDHPIKLMIESSAVTDLELVDLPGLTRNPIGEYLAKIFIFAKSSRDICALDLTQY